MIHIKRLLILPIGKPFGLLLDFLGFFFHDISVFGGSRLGHLPRDKAFLKNPRKSWRNLRMVPKASVSETTVDGSEIRRSTTWNTYKTLLNKGIELPTSTELVHDFRHQQYDRCHGELDRSVSLRGFTIFTCLFRSKTFQRYKASGGWYPDSNPKAPENPNRQFIYHQLNDSKTRWAGDAPTRFFGSYVFTCWKWEAMLVYQRVPSVKRTVRIWKMDDWKAIRLPFWGPTAHFQVRNGLFEAWPLFFRVDFNPFVKMGFITTKSINLVGKKFRCYCGWKKSGM